MTRFILRLSNGGTLRAFGESEQDALEHPRLVAQLERWGVTVLSIEPCSNCGQAAPPPRKKVGPS